MRTLYNVLATFFFAWCAVAAWLLLAGDESAIVRLAFALCGGIGVYTSSKAGLFRTIGKALDWGVRKRIWKWSIALLVVASIGGLLVPIFLQANYIVRSTNLSSMMKVAGVKLLEYAEAHDDTLPHDMRHTDIYALIGPANTVRSSEQDISVVWCGELSGLRLGDIKSRDQVVVAYGSDSFRPHKYSVLFLDGHVKYVQGRDYLNSLLRPRPILLKVAQERKAKRDAALQAR